MQSTAGSESQVCRIMLLHLSVPKLRQVRESHCSFDGHLVTTTSSLRRLLSLTVVIGTDGARGHQQWNKGRRDLLFWNTSMIILAQEQCSKTAELALTMDLERIAAKHSSSCFCYPAGASRWIGLQYFKPKAE